MIEYRCDECGELAVTDEISSDTGGPGAAYCREHPDATIVCGPGSFDLPLCPICHLPAHAAESDDLDRHPECVARLGRLTDDAMRDALQAVGDDLARMAPMLSAPGKLHDCDADCESHTVDGECSVCHARPCGPCETCGARYYHTGDHDCDDRYRG